MSLATASLQPLCAVGRACGVAGHTRLLNRGPNLLNLKSFRAAGRPSKATGTSLCVRATVADDARYSMDAECSALVHREAVLFLFQLELDALLQRALTYDDFPGAQSIRARREQVDLAVAELRAAKGAGCGARQAARSDAMDHAPSILRLRFEMQAAAGEERYADAAALRDQLAAAEALAAAAEQSAGGSGAASAPAFALGQMVVHADKGYRGVVAGWDTRCCESEEWQAAAGVAALPGGASQHFYHIMVDSRDWGEGGQEQPPMAYLAEECLAAGSGADFSDEEPLLGRGSFQHPYSYLMFLGSDGEGNMVPCRQLRDKYNAPRKDVYAPGELEGADEGEGEGEGPAGHPGDNLPPSPSGGGGAGGGGAFKLPGIDMRSLE